VTEPHLPLDVLGPPLHHASLLPAIRRANAAAGARIVVLDDDPLGGQCLHDVPVLTYWQPKVLQAELERSPMFLLVTNTRALARSEAIGRAAEVGRALREATRASGRTVTPVWRSDSTLRGHFYWEMQAFDAAFSPPSTSRPVYVFLPYFGDGGRYTVDATQYVLQDGALLPAAHTEFARDPAFAYTRSYLPDWLEQHSEGRFRAPDVVSIPLAELRTGGPTRVAEVLGSLPEGAAVIVDATADADLEVFVAGMQMCDTPGRRFLCSGAAPFVRVRAGMDPRPPLAPYELASEGSTGGLTVIGSHAERTGAQAEALLASSPVVRIELDLARLAPAQRAAEIARLSQEASRRLAAGEDVLLQPSPGYVPGAEASIADALDAVIAALEARPRFLLVKGGTTAGHVATRALGISRALVLGQLLPGVPVWRLGDESRWPGLPLAMFPGNVGTAESLAEALTLLRGG